MNSVDRIAAFADELRSRGSADDVAELGADFPFASFESFVASVEQGGVIIATAHDPLLVRMIGSVQARIIHWLFVNAAYFVSALLVGLGIGFERYWLFSGVPLAFLGRESSSPNLNIVDGCLPQIILTSGLVAAIFAGWEAAAVAGACWLCWLLASLGRAICQELIHAAIVRSKTVLVWLCVRGKVRILQRRNPD